MALFDKAECKRAERNEHAQPSRTVSGSAPLERGESLKVALPTPFDGSSAKARTFLAECNNYMALNQSRFASDKVRIQWALQLCTDRAANWKRTQLELAAEAYEDDGLETPDHLLHWESFQEDFRLKWADLNARQKAQQRFHAGIKQTGSVRRYVELFEETTLEAEFRDPKMVTSAFYNGLKYEVKRNLVGRWPDKLDELKRMAITLDEERMAAQDPDRQDQRDPKPKPINRADTPTLTPKSEPATCLSTPEVKTETARVGVHISEEEQAKRLKEGRCFGCGKQGHRRPECPENGSRTQVAATGTIVADPPPDSKSTRDEPKN